MTILENFEKRSCPTHPASQVASHTVESAHLRKESKLSLRGCEDSKRDFERKEI